MRYPEEPHTIVGGVPVHIGAVTILQRLTSTGHTVALDVDGTVLIEPDDDLPGELEYLLDAFEEDLAILLRAGGPTVH